MLKNSPTPRRGFGGRLAQLRADRHLTQEDLVRELMQRGFALTQGTLSKFERKTDAPSGATVAALAVALGTSADYLVGLTTNPYPLRPESTFFSPEADQIARLVDEMSLETRTLFVQAAESWIALDTARRKTPPPATSTANNNVVVGTANGGTVVKLDKMIDMVAELVGSETKQKIMEKRESGADTIEIADLLLAAKEKHTLW